LNFGDARAGDLNGDGADDLVLFSAYENSVRVYLNDRAGGFFPVQRPSPIYTQGVEGAALADFDMDGHLDLAVKGYYNNRITVLLGLGNGAFRLGSEFPGVYDDARGFEVGDIEGDERPDLFSRPWRHAVLIPFHNQGGGQFEMYREVLTPILTTTFSVGDFNNDGFADIAAAGTAPLTREFPNAVSRSIVLLRGDGQGGFAPFGDGSGPPAGDYPIDSLAADFNGDGNLDIVVLSVYNFSFFPPDYQDVGELRVFFGDGAGDLTPASVVQLPFPPASIEKGDFDLDGRPDIAVDAENFRKFAIVRNHSDSRFSIQRIYEQPYDPEERFYFLRPADLLVAGQFVPGGGIDLVDYSRVPSSSGAQGELGLSANSCPLDISLTAEPFEIVAGEDYTYRLRVTNVSQSETVSSVSLRSGDFPYVDSLSVTAPPGSCALSAVTLLCNSGSLVPGASFEAEIEARLSASHEGLVRKILTAEGPSFGPFVIMPANRAIFGVDLALAVAADPTVAVRGEPVVYQIVVRNRGTATAQGVELSQQLPVGATLVSAPGCNHSGGEANGGVLTCLLGDLAAKQSREYTVTVAALSEPGEVELVSTLEVGDALDAETFSNDNTASLTIPLVAPGVQASNASFEEPTLGPWQGSGPAEPQVVAQGHHGDWALSLQSGAAATQDIGGLQPGQLYSIAGWAKTADENSPSAARLEVADPSTGDRAIDGFRTVVAAWTKLQVLFRAGSSAVARVMLMSTSEAQPGVYWDDVEIHAVNPRAIAVPGEFATIQQAIEAAADGDRVVVAPGVYRENLNFLGKAIVLESRDGPEETIVDAGLNGPGVSFVSGEPASASLRGMHIRNSTRGVRVEGASPSIRNNRIWDNNARSGFGGGISVENGSPAIENNSIDGNRSGSGGGISIRFGRPIIRSNTIANNFADAFGGGGLWVVASQSLIEQNLIEGNESLREGGGVMLQVDQSLVRNNHILSNRATQSGGGISVSGGGASIEQNLIARNAASSGSGAALRTNGPSSVTFLQNTIAANESPAGAAVLLESQSVVRNNLIASPNSPAVACSGSRVIDFAANLVFAAEGAPFSNCSPAFDGVTIVADPLFLNPEAGDFRLGNGSRAIDAGTAVDPPAFDLDGQPRVVDGDRDRQAQIDIGAFERGPAPQTPPRVRSAAQ
jgi:uncharacterized repeat protein (TIGR01451 family)